MPFIAHSGLVVTNLERSIRFYCDLLGFKYDRELSMQADQLTDFLGLQPPGADLRAIYLYLGDFQLELMEFKPSGKNRVRDRVMNEVGLTHISIAVDDVNAVTKRLPDYGGELLTTIGDKAAMLRDPDGQLVEILESGYAGPERLRGQYGAAKTQGRL